MTVFEVGTSRHRCLSGVCTIFTFHHQEISGFLVLRPNRIEEMCLIVVGRSTRHCPSVYRHPKNIRSLIFLRFYHLSHSRYTFQHMPVMLHTAYPK